MGLSLILVVWWVALWLPFHLPKVEPIFNQPLIINLGVSLVLGFITSY